MKNLELIFNIESITNKKRQNYIVKVSDHTVRLYNKT